MPSEKNNTRRHLQNTNAARQYRARRATQETDEEMNLRRSRNAERERQYRAHQKTQETDEEMNLRRSQNAERVREHRARRTTQETDEEIYLRRSQNAEAARRYRIRRNVRGQTNEEPINDIYSRRHVHQEIATITEHTCGNLDVECHLCHSLNFIAEKPSDGQFNNCCHKGKIIYQRVTDYPHLLKELLSNQDNPQNKKFKKNIRSYNSALSFASMGAQIATPPGNGPYCFRANGQIYHYTSHTNPREGNPRSFAQLYVIDSKEATDIRKNNEANKECDEVLMDALDTLIRQINPYAQLYMMLREVEIQQNNSSSGTPPKVNLIFRRDRHSDQRRYNVPTTDEIGMVFTNNDGEPPFERDIKVYPRPDKNCSTQIKLNILSPNLDPMTYVLFYPHGEAGWQPNITTQRRQQNIRRNHISMLQWKVAQTAIRRNQFNPLLYGGKLFQQWLVDSHLQVEANNLNYIKNQQQKLRVEQYSGLRDHIQSTSNHQAGRLVILPSTFLGSPRNMRERYQDAMSIVGKYGKPDLFITMTSNPNWSEIKTNLYPGQSPSDRPDLIARVFNLKLKSLLDDILNKHLFGKHVAFVYSIEFQKRGLPHAHILLILENRFKFNTPDSVDDIISAEIPDQNTNPRLFMIVSTFMIHGPCGMDRPNAPCMKDGKCSKGFPKSYRESTNLNVDGYPHYMRRKGTVVQKGNVTLDNRNVIPYNKFLSLKYNCHINVEVCSSIKSIKYIFKYVYKGYDCANIEIQQENQVTHDEIKNYLDARYVSAPEAMWRLLENKMHDRSHVIIRLAVHLENEQLVYFHEGEERQTVERAAEKNTHLTAWFKLNNVDINAKQLLYTEIPYHYVFKEQTKTWEPRKRGAGKIISRMYTVSPKEIERYHLRLLLLNVRGPTSFENLRTVNNIVCSSYQEAARKLNLLDNDNEWIRCLLEASAVQMPSQFRHTFAIICIFNQPNEPLNLWETFAEYMIEDYRKNYDEQTSKNKALCDIQSVLKIHGLKCTNLGLPEPTMAVQEELDYIPENEMDEANFRIQNLNNEQKNAFQKIIETLEDETLDSRFLFLDGPGGTGKTYVYNTVMSYLRGNNKVVLPYATTGIAADILKGGRTIHSGFKLPIPILETSTSRMKINSPEAIVIKNACLIIIDEVSMMSSNALRCIDTLLKEIMQNTKPFGGKTMLLGGDFRQIPNVVPRGSNADIIEACIKKSPLWQHVQIIHLTKNMRSAQQEKFNNWILSIGNGRTKTVDGFSHDTIEIPEKFIETKDLIQSIYGNKINVDTPNEVNELTGKIILTTKNEHAIEINNKILALVSGEGKEYKSLDTIDSDDDNVIINYPTEFLHSQTPSGMPPHKLILKTGAIVMLIRNLNPCKGLLNGTRLIIRVMHENYLDTEILTGSNKGDRVFIPRIILAPSESQLPFILKRRQFPIIMAFAITINKSQGQTFNQVGLYLPQEVFSHGQLYVAVSRTKNENFLKIKIEDTITQGRLMKNTRVFTKNIILRQLLE